MSFLTACQKDNALQGTTEDNAWEYDVTLPVPIQFGETGPATKAAIEEFSKDLTFGVFAVNNEKDDWAASVTDVSTANDEKDDFIWYTETSKVMKMIVDASNKVVFETPQYYPIISQNSYDFYGYHPYTDDGNPYGESGATADVVGGTNPGLQITYDLDGKTDILWAHAKGETNFGVKGYNAKYIRAVRNGGAPLEEFQPRLEFRHQLARINFEVRSADKSPNEHVSVASATITNSYDRATLLVAASGEHPANTSGAFIDKQPGHVSVWRKSGVNEVKDFGNVYPDVSGKTLGYAFIVPTAEYDENADPAQNIIVSLALELDRDGKDVGKGPEEVGDFEVSLPYPEKGYLPGYEYTYVIVVYDAEEITPDVTLKSYAKYDGDYKQNGDIWDGDDLGKDEPVVDPYIELSSGKKGPYEYNDTKGEFSLYTNDKDAVWTISVEEYSSPGTPCTWLTDLSITSGSGTQTSGSEPHDDVITFTLATNDTGKDRMAKIRAVLGDVLEPIAIDELIVTQKKFTPKITAEAITFGSSLAETASTTVKFNYSVTDYLTDLEYEIDYGTVDPWLDESPVTFAGVENGSTFTLTLTASETNGTGADQTAVITITEKIKGAKRDIVVTRPPE